MCQQVSLDMVKRVMMHVGLGQTETRTIQTTLASNRRALARLGVVYPGDADAHHDLLALVHPKGPRHGWYQRQSISPVAAQCLADRQMSAIRAAAASGASVILLSSEFFQALQAPQFARLDHQVAALGYQLETLCYIREPLAHTARRIEQGVRRGTARIAQMMDRPYPPLARNHCQAALQALGRDRVHLRRVEDAQDGGLTADVLRVAGLKPAPGTMVDAPAEPRLCHDAVYLLDAINGDDADGGTDRALFHHYAAELDVMEGPPFTLPPDVARRVLVQSRIEQDWIFRHFHIRYPKQVVRDIPSHWQEMEWAADALLAVSQTDHAAQDWPLQQQAATA